MEMVQSRLYHFHSLSCCWAFLDCVHGHGREESPVSETLLCPEWTQMAVSWVDTAAETESLCICYCQTGGTGADIGNHSGAPGLTFVRASEFSERLPKANIHQAATFQYIFYKCFSKSMPVGVYHYPQSLPVLNVCTFSKLIVTIYIWNTFIVLVGALLH